ncbi:hypothetical protein [Leeuwenhoekiella sp. H156]|uniref:hypothetical protein n=1 Tax=Leeuwenhoekiella sp. H156 TaxID=3450128 RepID=UPI003FA478F0
MYNARVYGYTSYTANAPVGYGLFPYEVACSWVGNAGLPGANGLGLYRVGLSTPVN